MVSANIYYHLGSRINKGAGVLAVTRALGDSYMKELVTGHPYTTETVIQSEDEFILLACDGVSRDTPCVRKTLAN